MKFLRETQIEKGDYKPEKRSMYGYLFEAPQKQISRFNYDKINFKYNPYNLHPIKASKSGFNSHISKI